MKRVPEPLGARLRRKRAKLRFSQANKKNCRNYDNSMKCLNPENNYDIMYPKEKGEKMNGLIICAAIMISIGCYFVWSWADAYLFTVLGEVETCRGTETCYMYDALSIPARIACFMCGVTAITVFVVTWFTVYGILFL